MPEPRTNEPQGGYGPARNVLRDAKASLTDSGAERRSALIAAVQRAASFKATDHLSAYLGEVRAPGGFSHRNRPGMNVHYAPGDSVDPAHVRELAFRCSDFIPVEIVEPTAPGS